MFFENFLIFFAKFRYLYNLRPIRAETAAAEAKKPSVLRRTAWPNSASQSAAPPSASGGM